MLREHATRKVHTNLNTLIDNFNEKDWAKSIILQQNH